MQRDQFGAVWERCFDLYLVDHLGNAVHHVVAAQNATTGVHQIDDGAAINLGTMERTRVIGAARMVLERTGLAGTTIEPDPSKPTGPYNRVCDNSLGKRLLGWEPQVSFSDGLDRTIKWYFASKQRAEVSRDLERMLTER